MQEASVIDTSTYLDSDLMRKLPSDYTSGQHRLLKDLEDFILQDGFPCVGAQAAANSRSLAFGIFDDGRMGESIERLSQGLTTYLKNIDEKRGSFLTYLALFPKIEVESETDFERQLWEMLSNLHRYDALSNDWSKESSKDPDSYNFAFSFGGKAFFIVGMHPVSSRRARRFRHCAVAFNLQEQFDGLRSKGRFGPMRDAIRKRDMAFDGSINPMLSDMGVGLQAPQYSGRKVGPEWKCPFLVNER